MWVDVIVEYVFGFLFGLLVFQALFMRRMMGGSYGENVRRSFIPELLSMNLMMAGMAPVMIFLMMGQRHARDVARRATVLVRDVTRRHRRICHRVSGQCVARRQRR